MAWIEIVPDEQWAEREALSDLYDRVVDRDHGRIDHIMSIHSLNRAVLPRMTVFIGRRWQVHERCEKSNER